MAERELPCAHGEQQACLFEEADVWLSTGSGAPPSRLGPGLGWGWDWYRLGARERGGERAQRAWRGAWGGAGAG